MNETDRILQLVSEGILRPDEATKLLEALKHSASPQPSPAPQPVESVNNLPVAVPTPVQQTVPVQFTRPDGSTYTVELPPSLIMIIIKTTGIIVRESVRQAAQDTFYGLKAMVKNRANEMRDEVRAQISRIGEPRKEPNVEVTYTAQETDSGEARRLVLNMVQNGRISAMEATSLLEQIDSKG